MKLRTALIASAIAALGASAWAQGAATDPMKKPTAPATAAAPTAAAPATMTMPPAKDKAATHDKKAAHKKDADKKVSHKKKDQHPMEKTTHKTMDKAAAPMPTK